MIKAIVGAGGKTSLIHQWAEEYWNQGLCVLVTTATHMYIEEDTLASDDADEIISVLHEKRYVMAGISCGEKIGPLSKETFEKVCKHADIVLIEADGSKHMPIKYPASYEPVIYDTVDEIVIVCGLHAIGKTVQDTAHRLELVKACLGVENDTIVTASHIQKLVMKGYVEPMKEKYPDKKILVKASCDHSLYKRVAAKLMEAEIDVSIIKEEWFRPQPELVICGGGHVSAELVKMASCLDFRIKVIDDREEFASVERFPLADEVICDQFENLEKYMVQGGYYAVVTRGHKDDLQCVQTILKHSYQYLGMIGSRSKIKKTYDTLKKEGISEENLQTIYAPIGLDIGAQTPAEIAISILAQMIQVKNEKCSSFLPRELEQIQEKGTLCIIIEKSGSSPRGEGSMMFVTDTATIDTIGGGAVEYAAIQDARRNEKICIKEYDLNNQIAQNEGMICGGRNKVLFVPL